MTEQNAAKETLLARPGRCAHLLVWGAVLALVGGVVLVFGIRTYVDDTVSRVEQSVAGIVWGSLIAAPGLALLLVGVFRAATALDYLVQRRR